MNNLKRVKTLSQFRRDVLKEEWDETLHGKKARHTAAKQHQDFASHSSNQNESSHYRVDNRVVFDFMDVSRGSSSTDSEISETPKLDEVAQGLPVGIQEQRSRAEDWVTTQYGSGSVQHPKDPPVLRGSNNFSSDRDGIVNRRNKPTKAAASDIVSPRPPPRALKLEESSQSGRHKAAPAQRLRQELSTLYEHTTVHFLNTNLKEGCVLQVPWSKCDNVKSLFWYAAGMAYKIRSTD